MRDVEINESNWVMKSTLCSLSLIATVAPLHFKSFSNYCNKSYTTFNGFRLRFKRFCSLGCKNQRQSEKRFTADEYLPPWFRCKRHTSVLKLLGFEHFVMLLAWLECLLFCLVAWRLWWTGQIIISELLHDWYQNMLGYTRRWLLQKPLFIRKITW